jgi:nitroimidazol reductase NimA-like FMN-containing flavoprotein (pyridoxamine 5'-phosphate oxidase superfamily)
MDRDPDRSADDLAALAREIIDSNQYMTLATADHDGRPWASPVWFAHEGYADFVWASRPSARHSRNLSERPEVGIVIFDSTVAVGGGRAVYIDGAAEELTGAEREHGIETYSRRLEAVGEPAWRLEDVTASAPHRLYRARAAELFALNGNDERLRVEP